MNQPTADAAPPDVPINPMHDRGFLTLLYVIFCTLALMYAPQPLLPQMAETFGVPGSSAGLLISAVLLPLCLAPLVYGALLHAVPVRRLLMICVGLFAVCGIPMALSEHFSVALLSRLGQGLVVPAILTSVMATISDRFRGAQLQKALGIYIGITVAGSLMGRIGAGFLTYLMGWRGAWLLLIVCMLGALWPLRRLPAHTTASFTRITPKDFVRALRVPGVPYAVGIEFLNLFVFVGLTNCLPFRVMDLSGGTLSSFAISLLYAGYVTGVIVACVSSRIVQLCGGAGRTIVISLTAFVAALPVMLLPSVGGLFLGLCLICVFQFLEHSVAPGVINRMAPDIDTGVLNGLYLSIYYCGGVLGSYVPNLIYATYGWTAAVALLAAVLMLALGASLLLRRHVANIT